MDFVREAETVNSRKPCRENSMHPSSVCGAQPQGSCADCQVKYSENALASFGGQGTVSATSSIDSPAICLQMNDQPHLQVSKQII